MTELRIESGIGIYPRADAARLLGITPQRLRRWVGGYTYWLRATGEVDQASGRRRRQAPVITTDLPIIDRAVALSFLELMELRVVRAILDRGVSLQHIRAAAALARVEFATGHPFASRRVFTDGQAVFSAVSSEPDAPNVVKWKPGEIEQVIAGPIFEHFLQEIEFDARTALAHRWWPKGRATPIVLDPRIAFGAPTVEGTGLRTATVARLAHASSTEAAAVAFELHLQQAHAAVRFEAELAAA